MKMATADDDRRVLTGKTMTAAQVAARFREADGVRKIHQILAEPPDPDRNRRGLAAARQAIKAAHRDGV